MRFAKHLNGQIVRVVGLECEIDEELLLSALESRPQSAVGCWHALRVLHRCRRMGSCEAFVEGFNSVAAWLADARQNPDAHNIVCRLKLNLHGITAVGGADEAFVDALSKRMQIAGDRPVVDAPSRVEGGAGTQGGTSSGGGHRETLSSTLQRVRRDASH